MPRIVPQMTRRALWHRSRPHCKCFALQMTVSFLDQCCPQSGTLVSCRLAASCSPTRSPYPAARCEHLHYARVIFQSQQSCCQNTCNAWPLPTSDWSITDATHQYMPMHQSIAHVVCQCTKVSHMWYTPEATSLQHNTTRAVALTLVAQRCTCPARNPAQLSSSSIMTPDTLCLQPLAS
jgi:hypothetical protein